MLFDPLFHFFVFELAADGCYFVFRAKKISARQFTLPFSVDLEAQAFRKAVGKYPGLGLAQGELRQSGRNVFFFFRRIGRDQHQIQLGVFLHQLLEHGQFNDAVAASQRPEVDDKGLSLARVNDLLVTAADERLYFLCS